MRAWIGGMVHETSVFSPIATRIEDFSITRPRGRASGRHTPWPAYVDTIKQCRAAGIEAQAGWFAVAQPSAPLPEAAYSALKAELLADLEAALPVDFAVLVLHGAQSSDTCDDCEGDLAEAVRARLGPRTPIGMLLDLHTNLTPGMINATTAILACKEYPHTDFAERARELVSILSQTCSAGIRPCMAAVRVPLFGAFPTTREPFVDFVQRLKDAEQKDSILSVSAMHGFPGADSEALAASVLVVSDGNPEAALATALCLGTDFLQTVKAYGRHCVGVSDALDQVDRATRFPVIVADRSDNPGGGAAGDSTHLLRAILAGGYAEAALGMIWDPETVDRAHAAGAGAVVPLRIGGKAGPLSGEPVEADARVLSVRTDATQALFARGVPDQPLGRSAALRVDGVDIIVNDLRQQVFEPRCFTEHGVDPTSKRLVVVKSTEHFRAGFEAMAGTIIGCDPPGTVAADARLLPYRKVRRPIWPLDDDVSCEPFPGCKGP